MSKTVKVAGLKAYDYSQIMSKLQETLERDDLPETDRHSITIILDAMEDDWRMHWIDELLQEQGHPTTAVILPKYKALIFKP